MAKAIRKVAPTRTAYSAYAAGSWAFILGIILAIIAGILIAPAGWIVLLLGLLGLVVGLLNITSKETVQFLVASIALVAAASSFNLVLETVGGEIAASLQTLLGNIAVFVAPAAIVVALKTIFTLASQK